jgi:hypothetical protein
MINTVLAHVANLSTSGIDGAECSFEEASKNDCHYNHENHLSEYRITLFRF